VIQQEYQIFIFEKLPDGTAFWRACVSEQGEIERTIEELAQNSQNEFFAIELETGERAA